MSMKGRGEAVSRRKPPAEGESIESRGQPHQEGGDRGSVSGHFPHHNPRPPPPGPPPQQGGREPPGNSLRAGKTNCEFPFFTPIAMMMNPTEPNKPIIGLY